MLDFFADLLTRGTVLGVDHTSTLPEVEAALGREQTWPAPSGEITDTGLVEFGWWQGEVTYFGAQPHRLRHLRGAVGRALIERYGPFGKRLLFRDVDLAVRARGFQLEPRRSWNEGCAEYWEPSTRMGLIAVVDPDAAWRGARPGTVVKMLGPDRRRTPVVPDDLEPEALDDVVRAWLTSAAAALGTVQNLSPRAAAEVRVLRGLRNDVHELKQHLPHVRSKVVADELRAWVALRPDLLR